MKYIELLAPAKNLESGIAAINYGADAVYIGAPKFGARVAAGNSLQDIRKLVQYAHKYFVKVYVTLNTILYNHELNEAQELIYGLYETGVDAIIIQDLGILEMELPPIPLFASTQTNNYSWEKVKFLENIGIQRVILARELTLKQIKEITSKTNIELEFFVHGALCVSLSGQCYFSHAIKKGSANRGACAQPCRAYYSLKDSNNNTLIKNKHLLSLKGLNLGNHINGLLDAGITSFKIEGRLMDINYIKNITSYYRKQIDNAILNQEGVQRASSGVTHYDFEPAPEKTFNRGYSNYFLYGRNKNIASFDTPKSIGKEIGIVKTVHKNYFILDSKEQLVNGDGICFFGISNILQGLKINKIEGSRIYFDKASDLKPGTTIYRNFDQEFNKTLSLSKTERKILIEIEICSSAKRLIISTKDSDGIAIREEFEKEFEPANNSELALKNIQQQFTKSGSSIFEIKKVEIKLPELPFIPISELNEMRRKVLDLLEKKRLKNYSRLLAPLKKTSHPYPEKNIGYKGNVLNQLAVDFYKRHGVEKIENAFEAQSNFDKKEIMVTRHCIKFELGACNKYTKNPKDISEPLFIEDNNKTYRLSFDCKNCMMKVIYVD